VKVGRGETAGLNDRVETLDAQSRCARLIISKASYLEAGRLLLESKRLTAAKSKSGLGKSGERKCREKRLHFDGFLCI